MLKTRLQLSARVWFLISLYSSMSRWHQLSHQCQNQADMRDLVIHKSQVKSMRVGNCWLWFQHHAQGKKVFIPKSVKQIHEQPDLKLHQK